MTKEEQIKQLEEEENNLLNKMKENFEEDTKNGIIDRILVVINYITEIYSRTRKSRTRKYYNVITYDYYDYQINMPYNSSEITLKKNDNVIFHNNCSWQYNRRECIYFLDMHEKIIKEEYFDKQITKLQNNIKEYKDKL